MPTTNLLLKTDKENKSGKIPLYHRMIRNYMKGTLGDQINTLMATAAYNMMKLMRMKLQEFFIFIFRSYLQEFNFVAVNIAAR